MNVRARAACCKIQSGDLMVYVYTKVSRYKIYLRSSSARAQPPGGFESEHHGAHDQHCASRAVAAGENIVCPSADAHLSHSLFKLLHQSSRKKPFSDKSKTYHVKRFFYRA